tara:strand:- start:19579 stop:20886 length:1308 start_codon:yes stop_codon:yes gene_type:complete
MFIKLFSERVISVLGRDVVVSVINFFITTYIATSLGAEGFGLWIGVLTLLMVCDLLFRLKIDQLIVLYSSQYPNNIALYKKISFLSLQALAIGAVCIYGFSELIIDFFTLDSLQFLTLVFISFFISIFGNIIFYIFLSESKYNAYNFSILSQALLNGVSIYTLFQIYDPSILLPLVSLIISWLAVILFFLFYRLIKPNLHHDSKKKLDLTSKDILLKGSFIYASSAIRTISDQFPRLFAINFLGPAIVGYIGLAQIIVTLINRVPAAINTILYPMLVKEDINELEKCLAIIRALLILFLPIIFFLEFLMPHFISYFYGKEFITASLYIQILLPFFYIGLPGLVLSSYFASQGRFKDLFFINISAVSISILSLALVSSFAIEIAPIISLCMVSLTITTSSILIVYRQNSYINILPKKNDLLRIINLFNLFFIKKND